MKNTSMPNKSHISRTRYFIDATNLPLGRLASQISSLLRGKCSPLFAPHVDCGDFVTVINCDKITLTGNKLNQKCRYRHTGYIGHLKTIKYSDLMNTNPCKALLWAVKGMLPSNTLGRAQIKRLNVCCGSSAKGLDKMTQWTSFRKVRCYD